jgi:hypothetical protein
MLPKIFARGFWHWFQIVSFVLNIPLYDIQWTFCQSFHQWRLELCSISMSHNNSIITLSQRPCVSAANRQMLLSFFQFTWFTNTTKGNENDQLLEHHRQVLYHDYGSREIILWYAGIKESSNVPMNGMPGCRKDLSVLFTV